MKLPIDDIINLDQYDLNDPKFRQNCKQALDEEGALVMPDFLSEKAISLISNEGIEHQHLAFYTESKHNIYLKPTDSNFANDHSRNKEVTSSKGCITTDQIPPTSSLHTLYNNDEFKSFLCSVLNIKSLYEYADPLSSINLHYASEGQELGWHFDNSSFAITLLIQNPKEGGAFQYVKDVRDADHGEMNYELSEKILDGNADDSIKTLAINAGSLVLFRGRNSIHRVTPTIGDRTRMLVVLAYNTEPGVSLSESARITFYGRLG